MEHIFKEITNINEIAIQLARLGGDDSGTHAYYSALCDEIRAALYEYNDLLVYAKLIMKSIEYGLANDSDEITQNMIRAFVFRAAKRFLQDYNKMEGELNETN